jgi:hypothetical protein
VATTNIRIAHVPPYQNFFRKIFDFLLDDFRISMLYVLKSRKWAQKKSIERSQFQSA